MEIQRWRAVVEKQRKEDEIRLSLNQQVEDARNETARIARIIEEDKGDNAKTWQRLSEEIETLKKNQEDVAKAHRQDIADNYVPVEELDGWMQGYKEEQAAHEKTKKRLNQNTKLELDLVKKEVEKLAQELAAEQKAHERTREKLVPNPKSTRKGKATKKRRQGGMPDKSEGPPELLQDPDDETALDVQNPAPQFDETKILSAITESSNSLEAENMELKAQLAALKDQFDSENRWQTMAKKYLEFLGPIRIRWLLFSLASKANDKVMIAGNRAAHSANVIMDLTAFHLGNFTEEQKSDVRRVYGFSEEDLDELTSDFEKVKALESSCNETKLLNARADMVGYLALGGSMSNPNNDPRFLQLERECWEVLEDEFRKSGDKKLAREVFDKDPLIAQKLCQMSILVDAAESRHKKRHYKKSSEQN